MLQVAIIWGLYSIVMLIVEAIRHSSKMSSTVPCQVTARLTDRQPKNKKLDICQYTLEGYYDGGRISETMQELVKKGQDGRLVNGQVYEMRVNAKNGRCYDPAAGKEKIKGHAVTLGVSVVIAVIALLIVSVL